MAMSQPEGVVSQDSRGRRGEGAEGGGLWGGRGGVAGREWALGGGAGGGAEEIDVFRIGRDGWGLIEGIIVGGGGRGG